MKSKLHHLLLSYRLIIPVFFLTLTVQTGFAHAEQAAKATEGKKQEPLTITLTAQKVLKDARGKEVFSGAEKAKPGDVLEYRARYANASKTSLNSVMATLPVPKGMEYLDRSANPAVVTATVDGVKFEAVPLKRKIKDKTGKEVTQLVPVNEYKALRWALGDIQAGKERVVSARVSIAK